MDKWDSNKQAIIKRYLKGDSLRKLADQFDCSHEWINILLKKWGIRRPNGPRWFDRIGNDLKNPQTWFKFADELKPDITIGRLTELAGLTPWVTKRLLKHLGIYNQIIRPASMKDRILQKVHVPEDPDACWEWLGSRTVGGYPRFGALRYAHRVSFLAFTKTRKIPKGMHVAHSCHNRGCVNPKHLHLATAKENKWESIEAGRVPKWNGRRRTKLKGTYEDGTTRTFRSQQQAANTLNLHQGNISASLRGYGPKTHKGWTFEKIADVIDPLKPTHCEFENCKNKNFAHGLCQKHYDKIIRPFVGIQDDE